MNRWSLRNKWLKLETSGDVPILFKESIEAFASNEMKAKTEDRCPHVTNQLDLESLA